MAPPRFQNDALQKQRHHCELRTGKYRMRMTTDDFFGDEVEQRDFFSWLLVNGQCSVYVSYVTLEDEWRQVDRRGRIDYFI